jgi:bacterioferritin
MLDDWGVTKLGKHEYKESIEEMQHADLLIKRILVLGGLPNLQDLGKLFIGENVKEVLECDLKLELDGAQTYRDAAEYCAKAKDYVTHDLFKQILADEEGHIDHIETQLEMITQMGVENYIQLQSAAITEQE